MKRLATTIYEINKEKDVAEKYRKQQGSKIAQEETGK